MKTIISVFLMVAICSGCEGLGTGGDTTNNYTATDGSTINVNADNNTSDAKSDNNEEAAKEALEFVPTADEYKAIHLLNK